MGTNNDVLAVQFSIAVPLKIVELHMNADFFFLSTQVQPKFTQSH
jgi:hypothetical protein